MSDRDEKMSHLHIQKLGETKIGDTNKIPVSYVPYIPVSYVDRSPGDLLYVLAYITQINKQNMTFKFAINYDTSDYSSDDILEVNLKFLISKFLILML